MIASMWIGNLMLVILNLPLVGMWVRLLDDSLPPAVPVHHDRSARSACTRSTTRRSTLYWRRCSASSATVLIKLGCEPAPLLLGFVLGPLMEENLRRAMLISRGDWTVFLTRPLSAVLLGIAAFLLVLAVLPSLRKKRDEVFVEWES